METTFKKEYKKAKKKYELFEHFVDLMKSQKDDYLVIKKDNKPLYLRRGLYEGKLIDYTIINNNLTAVIYLNKNFEVKHEILPKKVFDKFLEDENHGRFFKIEYEIFGFGDEEEMFSNVNCYPNNAKPFWYENQEFKELAEMVLEDPEEKAYVLAMADEHAKKFDEF